MSSLQTASFSIAASPRTATAAPAKIKCEKLDFFYADKRALKSIDLEVGERQVTAMIGPSGCGKSTLLRVLNRMYDRALPGHPRRQRAHLVDVSHRARSGCRPWRGRGRSCAARGSPQRPRFAPSPSARGCRPSAPCSARAARRRGPGLRSSNCAARSNRSIIDSNGFSFLTRLVSSTIGLAISSPEVRGQKPESARP